MKIKKFKLIKEYPGSPKLGSIIMDTNPNNGSKDSWFEENWGKAHKLSFKLGINTQPDRFPEFWEEIKEKEYEILQCYQSTGVNTKYYYNNTHENWDYILKYVQNGSYPISKIKRLSDGEIFSLGDKVQYKQFSDIQGNITSFTIENNTLRIIYGNYSDLLNEITSSKSPLFITEDGKEVFEGDKVYFLNDMFGWGHCIAKRDYKLEKCYSKLFSSEQAILKYINENKPKYSLKQAASFIQKFDLEINQFDENSLEDYMKMIKLEYDKT